VATDGIMNDAVVAPRPAADWDVNDPFAAAHPEFVEEQTAWPFNESDGLSKKVTYWPGA
jgi:hypothetical protein